jgi:hypothetical protein
MWNIMVEGGYPMWFVLVFGLSGVVAALRYAKTPSSRALGLVAGLGLTTLFSVLTGIAAALAAVGHKAPAYMAAHPEQSPTAVLLLGFGESMSAGVLGFDLLTLMALAVSVGWLRHRS